MTWFDLIVFVIMGLSILFASFRGISREITTLASLGIAAVMAFWLVGPVAGLTGLSQSLMTNMLLVIVLFAGFFLLTTIGLNFLLGQFLGETPGKIDRAVGGVFGFLRGWLIVGLGYLALNYYFEAENRPAALTSSLTIGFARSAADILENLGLQTTTQSARNLDTDDTSYRDIQIRSENLS